MANGFDGGEKNRDDLRRSLGACRARINAIGCSINGVSVLNRRGPGGKVEENIDDVLFVRWEGVDSRTRSVLFCRQQPIGSMDDGTDLGWQALLIVDDNTPSKV